VGTQVQNWRSASWKVPGDFLARCRSELRLVGVLAGAFGGASLAGYVEPVVLASARPRSVRGPNRVWHRGRRYHVSLFDHW
jgi:hypothetical protein